MTSTPLPVYVPRDDAAKLTREERASLAVVVEELALPAEEHMTAVLFLRETEWDEEAAADRMSALRKELSKARPLALAEVRQYLGTEEDGTPKPYGVLLEDGRGQCARDKLGNPLVYITGGFTCDATDAIRQLVFINDRVTRYVHPSELPHVTYVFDMRVREGKHEVGSINWQFLRFLGLFPSGYTVYVVGASDAFVRQTNWIPSSMLPHMRVCKGYEVLHDALPVESMMPTWHARGTLDFDVERYLDYLAE